MIKNRLAVLLAERNLKITQVAKDTGISRNTITSTAQNDSKMIQLQTIDVLCNYLGITPAEFFEYYPALYDLSIFIEKIDIEVLYNVFFLSEINFNHLDADIYIDFKYPNNKTYSISLEGSTVEGKEKSSSIESFEKPDSLIELLIDFKSSEEKDEFVESVWGELNIGFQNELYEDIKSELIKELKKYISQNTNEVMILGSGSNLEKMWESDLENLDDYIKVNFASLVSK